MIEYPIGQSGQTLIFDTPVVEKFTKYRQLRFWHREAGGQLFGQFDTAQIHIVEATGPRRTDQRTRTSYVPDRVAEQREIDDRFRRGLHFVGDWHTHPEAIPHPSQRDISSIDDAVRKSKHSLLGFILVIVGQLPMSDGLHVSISRGDGTLHSLPPAASKA